MELSSFYKRFSWERDPNEMYSFKQVTDSTDKPEETDDKEEELTVRDKEATSKEKDPAAHCIININHLRQAVKDNMACRKCVKKREIDIMQNVVDELCTELEVALNISIPSNIILDFKKKYVVLDEPATMDISERHMGIATAFKLQCDSHLDHCHMIEPERSCFYGIKKEGSRSTHERLTWYNLNNQLVLSQLQNGAGTAEAATTLGF